MRAAAADLGSAKRVLTRRGYAMSNCFGFEPRFASANSSGRAHRSGRAKPSARAIRRVSSLCDYSDPPRSSPIASATLFVSANSFGRAIRRVSRLCDYSDPPRSSPIASATPFASAFPIASANSFGRANLLVSRLVIVLVYDKCRLGRRLALPESTTRSR